MTISRGRIFQWAYNQPPRRGESEERIPDEGMDLFCAVWRFCRGDWR